MKLNKEYAKKRRTRAVLIQSALDLMGENKGFDSLGLREVTRKAELAPAAFYRHFKSLEELGLALVEDVSLKLRGILREARRNGLKKTTLKKSTLLFFEYVRENKILFRFIVREKNGGNTKIRTNIRKEMDIFAAELADDLPMKNKTKEEMLFIADFVITTCFNIAGEYLDNIESHSQRNSLESKALGQLVLIYKGAR